jgi:hypothetical protein
VFNPHWGPPSLPPPQHRAPCWAEKVANRDEIAPRRPHPPEFGTLDPRGAFSISSGVAGTNPRKTARYAGKNCDPLQYGPDDTFFNKVRTSDNSVYVLRRHSSTPEGEWSLESSRDDTAGG